MQSIPPAIAGRTILSGAPSARTQVPTQTQTQTQTQPTSQPATAPAADPNAQPAQTQQQPVAGTDPFKTGETQPVDESQKKSTALQRPSQLGPAPGVQQQPAGVAPPLTQPQGGVAPKQEQPIGQVSTAPGRAGQPAAQTGVSPSSKLPVERGSLQVEVGGCAAFRLAGGSEMECDRGGDIEFHSTGGTAVRMEAEGIRSLGMQAVSQDPPPNTQATETSAAAQPGVTYLVQLARGQALVRVVQVRAARPGGPSGRPRLRPREGADAEADAQKTAATAMLTVVLEWRMLSE